MILRHTILPRNPPVLADTERGAGLADPAPQAGVAAVRDVLARFQA